MNLEIHKSTILIVDDMPENLSILGELLREKYHIKVATSGEKALQIVNSGTPPDLILLDVVMSGMDGYEVCRTLKRHDLYKKIPVIFITSKSEDMEEVAGFEAGAVDYIIKPFNPIVVTARVNTHIELKRYRDWLENSSYTDTLTELPNRRRFDENFSMAWHYNLRDQSPLSIIMIDIDNFKAFNDHYGHQVGDECIKHVAHSFSTSIKRKVDIIARYGGEEFICVLPNTTNSDAVVLAEALRNAVLDLRIPHDYSDANCYVTISLGVSTIIPQNDMRPQELIVDADRALYQAKREGRNRVISRIFA